MILNINSIFHSKKLKLLKKKKKTLFPFTLLTQKLTKGQDLELLEQNLIQNPRPIPLTFQDYKDVILIADSFVEGHNIVPIYILIVSWKVYR